MSQGKRLVLEDNDFIDEEDEQQQQANNNNNNSQKKVVGISSSSSSNNNNNNNNSGNGAQQQVTIDSQLLRSSRPDVEKIISAHRQSLIGLQSGNGGSNSSGTSVTADDLQKFNSITLSKRHLYSDTDYEKGLDLETFKKLSNFKFDSSAEANAKQQQQQQTNSNTSSNAAEKK